MRKIISKKQGEKEKKRNQIVVGVILIAVMFFSVLGYSLNGAEKNGAIQIDYHGFKFTQDTSTNLWDISKGDFNFSFEYNPFEVGVVNTTLNSLNDYNGKPLYISSGNSEAAMEIYRNLFYQNQVVQRVQEACLNGEKCSGDFPVKTCDDNFIIIQESNSPEIKQQGNCVFIKGTAENLSKMSDSFLLKIIGIQ